MNDTPRVDSKEYAKSRSRLTKLELNVAALPDIPQKAILKSEIERARDGLEAGQTAYSDALWGDIRGNVWRIKWYYRILPNKFDSNILLWLKGLILYSFIVLLIFGPCAVIVHAWAKSDTTWIVKAVKGLKLDPLFDMVMDNWKIPPMAYLWGLLGGAGAVVSMVRRFETIESQKVSFWLVFAQGLFNPIVGSLSAIIACHYYKNALKDPVSQIPLLVLAFFAGFSERILAGVGTKVEGSKKAP